MATTSQFKVPRKDLKRQVFRAGGPGGQHQNKTESAVRWVHIPTGIAAESRSERSQHTNSGIALDRLMDRLAEFVTLRRGAPARKAPATFGADRRCYRLAGNGQGVHDYETEHKEPNARAVLAGKLDGLIEAQLRKELAERAAWVDED